MAKGRVGKARPGGRDAGVKPSEHGPTHGLTTMVAALPKPGKLTRLRRLLHAQGLEGEDVTVLRPWGAYWRIRGRLRAALGDAFTPGRARQALRLLRRGFTLLILRDAPFPLLGEVEEHVAEHGGLVVDVDGRLWPYDESGISDGELEASRPLPRESNR